MKISMLVVGTVMVAGLAAGSSYAFSSSDTQMFCKAIGISEDSQLRCAQQMMDARSMDERDQVAAKWVANSPIASKNPSSLYRPPADANTLNGTPGTAYQDKVTVSNEVNAQIRRAMKIDNIDN